MKALNHIQNQHSVTRMNFFQGKTTLEKFDYKVESP